LLIIVMLSCCGRECGQRVGLYRFPVDAHRLYDIEDYRCLRGSHLSKRVCRPIHKLLSPGFEICRLHLQNTSVYGALLWTSEKLS